MNEPPLEGVAERLLRLAVTEPVPRVSRELDRPILGPYLLTLGVGIVEGLIFYVLFEDATAFRNALFLSVGTVWLTVGTDNFRSYREWDLDRVGGTSFAVSLISYIALVIFIAKQVQTHEDRYVWFGFASMMVAAVAALGGRIWIRLVER